MLKTITKFVLQRRRRVQQPQPEIVEEYDRRDPAVASGDLPETAEPQLDEPPSEPVLAKVKWYNPERGMPLLVDLVGFTGSGLSRTHHILGHQRSARGAMLVTTGSVSRRKTETC
jgi:hypothetical protein